LSDLVCPNQFVQLRLSDPAFASSACATQFVHLQLACLQLVHLQLVHLQLVCLQLIQLQLVCLKLVRLLQLVRLSLPVFSFSDLVWMSSAWLTQLVQLELESLRLYVSIDFNNHFLILSVADALPLFLDTYIVTCAHQIGFEN
jgi:hypothetical protein